MRLSANKIKALKALSSKKGRDEAGLFLVEGRKMVDEAIASSFEVVEILESAEIGEDVMARISSMSTPPPVVAVVRQKPDTALPTAPGLYLALDAIRDPGNLGTIIRIADWFGIRSVIASPDTVELYNPKVIQSTMGAVFRVDFHRTDIVEYSRRIRNAGGRIYGTFLDGEDIYGCHLDNGAEHPSVIVIGNESNGISREVAAVATDRLRIPSFPGGIPTSESLNAAVATAVTVAEFRRRAAGTDQ